MSKDLSSKHDFIVDKISCDWVTAGSFDERNKRRWVLAMQSLFPVSGYDVKSMMYIGESYGRSGFVGQAEQNGRIHTLCRVTGMDADKAIYKILQTSTSDRRFTRIDLQLTIPLPDFFSSRRLADGLRKSQRLKVTLIESDDGLDTIYVGSRQSSTMWRIYVKEDEKGGRYLRFEIEVKNGKDNTAERLSMHIHQKGRVGADGYFWERLTRLNLPIAYVNVLKKYKPGKTAPLEKVVRDTSGKKFSWLNGVVRKAIVSYACSAHGREQFMVLWLAEIQQEILRGARDDTIDI